MNKKYKTEAEILSVVDGFENCTTGKEEFSHLSHLTVATFYVLNSDREEAFKRMCTGLLRFIDHHGVNPAKYDEPLTLAWINEIDQTLRVEAANLSMRDATNVVIEKLARKRVTVPDASAAQ